MIRKLKVLMIKEFREALPLFLGIMLLWLSIDLVIIAVRDVRRFIFDSYLHALVGCLIILPAMALTLGAYARTHDRENGGLAYLEALPVRPVVRRIVKLLIHWLLLVVIAGLSLLNYIGIIWIQQSGYIRLPLPLSWLILFIFVVIYPYTLIVSHHQSSFLPALGVSFLTVFPYLLVILAIFTLTNVVLWPTMPVNLFLRYLDTQLWMCFIILGVLLTGIVLIQPSRGQRTIMLLVFLPLVFSTVTTMYFQLAKSSLLPWITEFTWHWICRFPPATTGIRQRSGKVLYIANPYIAEVDPEKATATAFAFHYWSERNIKPVTSNDHLAAVLSEPLKDFVVDSFPKMIMSRLFHEHLTFEPMWRSFVWEFDVMTRQFFPVGYGRPLTWTPDGRHLVYAEFIDPYRITSLWKFDQTTRRNRLLFTFPDTSLLLGVDVGQSSIYVMKLGYDVNHPESNFSRQLGVLVYNWSTGVTCELIPETALTGRSGIHLLICDGKDYIVDDTLQLFDPETKNWRQSLSTGKNVNCRRPLGNTDHYWNYDWWQYLSPWHGNAFTFHGGNDTANERYYFAFLPSQMTRQTDDPEKILVSWPPPLLIDAIIGKEIPVPLTVAQFGEQNNTLKFTWSDDGDELLMYSHEFGKVGILDIPTGRFSEHVISLPGGTAMLNWLDDRTLFVLTDQPSAWFYDLETDQLRTCKTTFESTFIGQ